MTLDPQEGATADRRCARITSTYPQAVLFHGNWFQDYPDPQNWISIYWNSTAFASRIGYNSQRAGRAGQARATQRSIRRSACTYYEQAGQILLDDLPAPFVYQRGQCIPGQAAVTGYTGTAANSEIPGQWGSLLLIDKAE